MIEPKMKAKNCNRGQLFRPLQKRMIIAENFPILSNWKEEEL